MQKGTKAYYLESFQRCFLLDIIFILPITGLELKGRNVDSTQAYHTSHTIMMNESVILLNKQYLQK